MLGIGLILVLGVILGADANDAYVISLGLSPSHSGPQGPASRHHISRPLRLAGQMSRCVTFWERSHSGLARSNANRVSP